MRTRLTILLLGAALALGACGSSHSANKAEETNSAAAGAPAGHPGKGAGAAKQAHRGGPSASAGGNASLYRSSSGNPEERRSDRLAGVYVEAARICATSTPGKVAKNVGSKSTDPKAIATALAKGFLPKLRKTAYKGCLSSFG
jgi:hypothetical protein